MVLCRLSTLLGTKRWSQRELCRRTGLHPVTVGRLFHDEWQEINRETVDRLCKTLGVGVDELFHWVHEPTGEGQ